ncbi:rRNA-processing protein FCF1 [Nosema bombycis CQ1]|uniref:rRNA-processing protein FCF1 n=1 Tax=Nosema bombycis (strain CQ1 / CVCC 102059) TaxID=578461 RepID=R0KSK1_NOSB1|nr:rRNA-processing protein FCF1 [Nosema bombycis CQ1]|eukprot:EOB13746.1 rRNA-processing protein FCF1 [Nosema bombycis CQ1]
MAKNTKFKTKKILNIDKNKNKTQLKEEKKKEIPKLDEIFIFNQSLRPPYNVLLDTNFINDCIRKRKDFKNEIMEALGGSIKINVPECVYGELEKLGRPFRVGLALIRGDEINKLKCDHKGTYADDCIVDRITKHRCYVVATSDTALKQRIKEIPGVPIITFRGRKIYVDRFMQATF